MVVLFCFCFCYVVRLDEQVFVFNTSAAWYKARLEGLPADASFRVNRHSIYGLEILDKTGAIEISGRINERRLYVLVDILSLDHVPHFVFTYLYAYFFILRYNGFTCY